MNGGSVGWRALVNAREAGNHDESVSVSSQSHATQSCETTSFVRFEGAFPVGFAHLAQNEQQQQQQQQSQYQYHYQQPHCQAWNGNTTNGPTGAHNNYNTTSMRAVSKRRRRDECDEEEQHQEHYQQQQLSQESFPKATTFFRVERSSQTDIDSFATLPSWERVLLDVSTMFSSPPSTRISLASFQTLHTLAVLFDTHTASANRAVSSSPSPLDLTTPPLRCPWCQVGEQMYVGNSPHSTGTTSSSPSSPDENVFICSNRPSCMGREVLSDDYSLFFSGIFPEQLINLLLIHRTDHINSCDGVVDPIRELYNTAVETLSCVDPPESPPFVALLEAALAKMAARICIRAERNVLLSERGPQLFDEHLSLVTHGEDCNGGSGDCNEAMDCMRRAFPGDLQNTDGGAVEPLVFYFLHCEACGCCDLVA